MSTIFFSYSHKDEQLRDRLETALATMKRQGLIEAWHDRRLQAGDDFDHGIRSELERADVILLLVSPDFIASDYYYCVINGAVRFLVDYRSVTDCNTGIEAGVTPGRP